MLESHEIVVEKILVKELQKNEKEKKKKFLELWSVCHSILSEVSCVFNLFLEILRKQILNFQESSASLKIKFRYL